MAARKSRKRGVTPKPPGKSPAESPAKPLRRGEQAPKEDDTTLVSPIKIYLISVVLKALLVYTYASTDLDVHTNWLAITQSRHFKDWYADGASSSIWTLDYPPFFAWFEFGLGKIAGIFPTLRPYLDVENDAYMACGRQVACLLFQRFSVMASEFVLFAAVYFATIRERRKVQCLAVFLVLFHPGLLLVDHMHFQYNGLLLGLLLISMTMASYGNDNLATVAFSITLCFKHIFLYVAPAFGCYYLGVLFNSSVTGLRRIRLFLSMALAASGVLVLAFGPVAHYGMMGQMLKRLFPLQRGLIHAYWAPNFWALYAAADKALSLVLGKGRGDTAAFTGGLVQVTAFRVLPQITSGTTVALTLVAMLPALVGLLRWPLAGRLWPAVVYCSLCSFMFGYHVHEKAILMTLIPMAVSAAKGREGCERSRGRYVFLSLIGTYSLFPLFTGVEEYWIKVSMLVGYALVARIALLGDSNGGALSWLERMYCTYGIVAVELYASFVHDRIFGEAWPFVPLMLVSVYAALGVAWTWATVCLEYLYM